MIAREDFRKKREEMAVNIRKDHREQIFKQRRNIEQTDEQEYQQQSLINENFIIDASRHQKIQLLYQLNFSIETLPKLLSSLRKNDPDELHFAMVGIRKLICNGSNINREVMHHFPQIIKFMEQAEYPQLKLEAVWVTASLASAGVEFCEGIIKNGGVEVLIKLVGESEEKIIDHVLFTLGNLSAQSPHHRDYILKEQGLVALLRLLSKTTSPFLLKIGCWAVSNLCRSYPYPPYELVKPALPFFCKILVNGEVSDKETMADILWAMSSLTQGGKSKLKFIIESGVIGKLFTYCSEPFDKISIPALRILGNFSLGNSVISSFLLTNNILQVSISLLDRQNRSIRKQISWILSNLAAGNESNVHQLISNLELINKLLQAFMNDLPVVKRQIASIFSNFALHGDTDKLLTFYLDYNIFQYFENWLSTEVEPKNLLNALQSINKILCLGDREKIKESNINLLASNLKSTSLLNKIEQLHHHKNLKISQLASQLLNDYFDD